MIPSRRLRHLPLFSGAFRGRGDAALIFDQGPTVREQTLATVLTGQTIG